MFANKVYLVSLTLVFGFAQAIGYSIPTVDPRTFPVPGKPFNLTESDDPWVTFHEFKYRGRDYMINTSFSDGLYHNAKGLLKTINGVKLYVETGNFAEKIDNKTAYNVEYIIDGDGYHELNREKIELLGTRISSRGIGTILG